MSDSTHTDGSNYGYTPTGGWCIAFITLFSVAAAVHSVQALRSKYWIIFPTLVLGALVEVLGWSARYWSSRNVTLLTPFLMQICTLILAPVFFSAYDYVVLGMAINRLGPQYSFFRPNWYFAVFITADVISLILQAIGGGQAASSAATSAPTTTATNIMVAGIIFQLVAMGVFLALGADFILRATAQRPYAFREAQIVRAEKKAATKAGKNEDGYGRKTLTHVQSDETVVGASGASGAGAGAIGKAPKTEVDLESQAQVRAMQARERGELRNWWILLLGVGLSSLMIFVRGIYRSIELTQGWSGYLISHEIYQNTLDGIPMILAVAIYIVIHPMFLLPRKRAWKGYH